MHVIAKFSIAAFFILTVLVSLFFLSKGSWVQKSVIATNKFQHASSPSIFCSGLNGCFVFYKRTGQLKSSTSGGWLSIYPIEYCNTIFKTVGLT